MPNTSKKCPISKIWHKNMPVGNTGEWDYTTVQKLPHRQTRSCCDRANGNHVMRWR